jgi:hypothetical protein
MLSTISLLQDIHEWYPEQVRPLNSIDGYYSPLRYDPQICLWPAARLQEELWVASFQAVVTEVSISIFEVEITMEDAKRSGLVQHSMSMEFVLCRSKGIECIGAKIMDVKGL